MGVVIGLAVNAAYAEAPADTGNAMLPMCKFATEGDYSPGAAICIGMVEATRNLASFLPDPFRSCPPEPATNGQAIRVVIKFMESHPERLHEKFQVLLLAALREVWRCE
jgi:hypothetical protein